MSFLGLSFLFALPLIALPVIIHLYRGRQRDVIPWGAMQFLTDATTKGRSMQRLEEMLLMLLRMAAILALIFALARPMLQSSWFGTGADREVVLLLDNSLSMARTIDEVSACDQMIEQARELVDGFSSSDQVHVMLAAGGGQWLTPEGLAADDAGKQRLNALLEKIEPSLGTADLLKCLQIVVNMEPQQNPASRRVIVFSDDQARNWQLDAEGGWRQLGSARENSPIPTSVEINVCGFAESELNNLAVMRLEASRQLVRPEERIEFTAQVANVGEIASEETRVEWLIEDKVFETTELRSLAAREATQIAARLRPEDAGNFAVSCRIQSNDQIALDGTASVVIEVSDQLPILLVHDPEADMEMKTADELFAAALGYEGGVAQDWHAIYRPELVTVDKLADTKLANYRAVVMLSLSELPIETEERIQAFVRSGGGLWMALGDLIDRETFNRSWYDDGDGLSPISLDSVVSVADTNKPEGSIHPPERDHPATQQLANTTQLDIDQARLSQYWQLVNRGDEERQAWVLLESGNGNPLVVENIVGSGRVLVQAFPLGLEWGNLPQLKSYVVMVQDWLDYLTAPAMARYNLEPGNAITAPLPADAELASAKLVTPAGQEVALATEGGEANGLVRYSQTQLPGLYRMTMEAGGNEVNLPFYVSRDPSESEWLSLAEADRTQLTETAGLLFDGAAETTEVANVEPRPRSEPIWGALLLALLGLLAGEQLLSNWLTRQRSGVAVTTT